MIGIFGVVLLTQLINPLLVITRTFLASQEDSSLFTNSSRS
ncbi:MAG: hypothetical protein ACRBFS_11380 [Aureispira sp.]